ncbi:MAG: hypothetical protein A2534_02200 [Candidatus Magasanikbacteria bacterium RIFOXYD2_FULL_39_9]|uniref:Polymerase nucleotidyl transferase domain-containing protein n=1 Tax=Candidatus Magasanikbacteria bacterium RIFOXYD1_FULL_40_23 TaxID=1798705 RepID=A0A1F6P9T6_9BACT|nr:MAG: hypothetical protein A2563_03980 [Candidatus Magasanikbacteria bacterium RIFOXYD1_FULL_40_23]OGH93510.1 MAG: hypothetical protein A2534_02200 [Candidatus Magasanikbacteria bacterium RIFOXYD2_FULL_39_9]
MELEQSLRQSILSTLAYFDLSQFPLTKEELFVFLWEPPTVNYADFLELLQTDSFVNGNFETKNGYYFLPGRQELVEIRRRRLIISEKKLKIARRALRIIRSVPFLKAVFVCNTVASEQASIDSDIDFFIVTAKNRIWITRLFVTFLLGLFRLRRVKNRVKDKICLSFYVTEEALDLSKFRVIDDDVHFAFWINQMLPAYDPDNFYAKFLEANSWTKKYLPNINSSSASSYIFRITNSKLGKIWKSAWEKMWEGSYGSLINEEAKKIQISKMKFSGNKIDRGDDKGVVISDSVLKFHEKDTRIEYRELWKNKIGV